MEIETEIKKCLTRYHRFGHLPNLTELHQLLGFKTNISDLDKILQSSMKAWRIEKVGERYRSENVTAKSEKLLKELERNAQYKLRITKGFLSLVNFIDGILLMGVSGSVATGYAKKNDDIDIFVITKAKMLWRVRFFLILATYILGVKRKRNVPNTNPINQDRYCFNLIISETDLLLPRSKDTSYVASEIYFLKLIMNKEEVYERFLKINEKTISKLPNADYYKTTIPYPPMVYYLNIWQKTFLKISKIFYFLVRETNLFEIFFGLIQKLYMRPHMTTELITPNQLWFHPRDLNEK